MPIPYFLCENCHASYQFESEMVGQAVRCRGCGYVFRVPTEGIVDLESSTPPPPQPRGTGRWYLRFPNGRQFGPVLESILQEWLTEERATEQSWILEEGTQDWQQLGTAFPEWFQAAAEAAENDVYAPKILPITQIPAAGFLDQLDDEFALLPPEEQEAHLAIKHSVQQECLRAGGYVRVRSSKSFRVGDNLVFGETERLPEEAKPDSVVVCGLTSQSSEFYLVVPWSKLGRLPHEFISVLPGRLPSSIGLRRKSPDGFDGGVWVGICGTELDVLAVAAKRSQEDLAKGVKWQWLSDNRRFTMVLVWGVQAVPLGDEKYVHLVQSTFMGPNEQDFGILWYLERQSAFYKFARRLSLPQDHETHFLFSTCAGQLLTRSLEHEINAAAAEE